MNKYDSGNLVIHSDFEIREIRNVNSDIDLLIPLDLRVLNLYIDNMPEYINDRLQFREVRNIIIRFTTDNDDNYCTVHILNNIDLQSSMVNFTMKYEEYSIKIVRSDYSVEMFLRVKK
jgi:uncharacterized protein YeeX (DUF496 family)